MHKIRENLSKTYLNFYIRVKTKIGITKKNYSKILCKFYYFIDVLNAKKILIKIWIIMCKISESFK